MNLNRLADAGFGFVVGSRTSSTDTASPSTTRRSRVSPSTGTIEATRAAGAGHKRKSCDKDRVE